MVRNDQLTVDDVAEMSPDAIVISPGPCTPVEAGISVEVVRQLSVSIPILGICLGHQSIAAGLGGKVIRAEQPVHGRTSQVLHDGTGLFKGVSNPLQATRYHSLIVDEKKLPTELAVTARLEDGTIMAIEHQELALFGLQFHPESVLTHTGHLLLANFLKRCDLFPSQIPSGDFSKPVKEPSWVDDDWESGKPLHW